MLDSRALLDFRSWDINVVQVQCPWSVVSQSGKRVVSARRPLPSVRLAAPRSQFIDRRVTGAPSLSTTAAGLGRTSRIRTASPTALSLSLGRYLTQLCFFQSISIDTERCGDNEKKRNRKKKTPYKRRPIMNGRLPGGRERYERASSFAGRSRPTAVRFTHRLLITLHRRL